MQVAVALLLAHINPLTKTHVQIISKLSERYRIVHIFPVRFLKDGKEINTKSFPFPFPIRKNMIESVFANSNNIVVSDSYTFYSPFIKYLPPFLSPYSWILRNSIARNVTEGKFISYTGDRIERIALSLYRLNPIRARRLDLSASSVRRMLYCDDPCNRSEYADEYTHAEWQRKVPEGVVQLINQNWHIVKQFAHCSDRTIKCMGLKFPIDGFF